MPVGHLLVRPRREVAHGVVGLIARDGEGCVDAKEAAVVALIGTICVAGLHGAPIVVPAAGRQRRILELTGQHAADRRIARERALEIGLGAVHQQLGLPRVVQH